MFDLASACDAAAKAGGLSEREQAVLMLMVARATSEDEAASQLGISTHTVHTHVRSIYLKLDVHNRLELLKRVLSFGEE